MRFRAAGLIVALAAVLPAVASAQQMAAASPRAPLHDAPAPMSKRDLVALESRLQHVALLQELYYTEHHTYASDLAALAPKTVRGPRVEIVAASSEGWTARVAHPSLPGAGCTMSVVAAGYRAPAVVSVAASGGTANGKRSHDTAAPRPADRPAIVCDRA